MTEAYWNPQLYGEYLQYYDVLNVDGVIDAQKRRAPI